MRIRRIVPNIYTGKIEQSKQFYSDFLGLKPAMDLGWVVTFASETNLTAQLTIVKDENLSTLNDAITIAIEVFDIDMLYEMAIKKGYPIASEIKNEDWGIRRFMVRDPNNVVLYIMSHL